MPSKSSQHLEVPKSSNLFITDEKSKESRKKKKTKYSIYQIVNMKIFFVRNKNRKSKSSKSSKSSKLASENKVKDGTTLEFVFTVTDFDEEQVIKAKSYIKSSKYSEALSILEQVSNQSMKSDYEVLFWIGHCHEYLQNFQLADKYYKICADYLFDDGYWETTYGKFLLKNSDLNRDERVKKGIDRLMSAANKKRYVSAMYILGKVYMNGLYDVKQDFHQGEFYLKRAYNGGEKERSWAIFEKKAKELVASGQLSKVPEELAWAKNLRSSVVY